MQPRNAALLFLVAAALGAFVYLYEIRGEASRDSAERESHRMFAGLEADAIGFVAFRTRDDRAFEAVRQETGWLIQSPLAFAGDDVSLDAMASTLANLETEASIENPGAPEIYGLGDAARWVRFRVGSETHGLGIGSDTPVGGNVYVAREGASEIYTVPSFRVSSFDRDFADLRDKRVVDFDRTRVNRIVLGWQGGSVTLTREEAGAGWKIARPARAVGRADEATIDSLLSDLAFLRADDFVDDPTPAIEDEAFLTVRLGLAATEGEALEIGLRAVNDPGSDDFLVRSGEGGALFKVARGRLVEVPRDVFAYRYKQISGFDVADAQAFEVEFRASSESSSVEPLRERVERVAQGWKATGAPWRPGKAGGLIAELARLEAIAVVVEAGETVEAAELGLAPPRVVLRAFGKVEGRAEGNAASGAPLLAEVELGRSDEGVGIVARAKGEPVIYRIDEDLAVAIPLDLERYEAEFLAPANEGASDGEAEARAQEPVEGSGRE